MPFCHGVVFRKEPELPYPPSVKPVRAAGTVRGTFKNPGKGLIHEGGCMRANLERTP